MARAPLAFLVCGVVLWGVVLESAGAAVTDDSVGIYSEELERANSVNPVAAGHAQRGAGIGLVRQQFSWARIETSPGHLDFSVYDSVMATAAIANLAVLPVLMDPPRWRSTAPVLDPGVDMYPPSDPNELAVLAGLLVQRYGPGGAFWAAHPELIPKPIHSWQVWNEPNLPDFWATGPDPAAYAELLRVTAKAIREADPTAEVVAAGLPSSSRGMPLADFLDGLYAAGARGSFDTLAIHPYARDAAGVLDILERVRVQVDSLGDGGRPIWATEFGWATDGPASAYTTSEAAQATLLRDVIADLKQARTALGLRGFVVFRWRDVPLNPGQDDSWPLNTGLVRKNGSAKPGFDAFRDAVDVWRGGTAAGGGAGGAGSGGGGAAGAPGAGQAPAGATSASGTPARARRVLRIKRYVSRKRLFVSVLVPAGGRGQRVRISYRALRGKRAPIGDVREVASSKGVARVVFKLTRSARSATLLRITATQGTDRATRDLRLRPKARKRSVSRPSAG